MEQNLKLLADKLGIATHFCDAGMARRAYDVSEDLVRFFCAQFGYKADTPEQIAASLQKIEDRKWRKGVESIYVLRRSNLHFDVYLKKAEAGKFRLRMSKKDEKKPLEVTYAICQSKETKTIGRSELQKFEVAITSDLDYGYYDFELQGEGEIYRSVLACVPEKCYSDEAVESGRLWGFAVQLYAMKSRRNWGVGDFTDLKNLVQLCAETGADIIGLNPLNVLFHDFPENASPYSSINRLFLNPIYIDPTEVPDFKWADFPNLQADIDKAKSSELIDYIATYRLKMHIMERLYAGIDRKSAYGKQFEAFKKEKGWELEMLATYQALYHEQSQKVWGGCAVWEKNLQNPHSLQVAQFKKEHAGEIEFFEYLQFEADRQLQEVYREIKKCGLKIGLYRDLPVGVCKDSAEFWADRPVFVSKAGAGAPPDAFFPCGQKWCLGAFNPFELKDRAYEPFIKILRANMSCAGALRIDHVMGLMRLFMIPDEGDEGTYIYYNFDDMLGILALESYRHQCVVIGESIGNVPDGFLEKLKENRIYAISVLWSERWNGGYGDFKMPRDYPQDAFVSVGTHDMPPLKMWWFGYEIELMHRLKMYSDQDRLSAYKRREADRKMLLAAMDFNKVWPQDKTRGGDYLYGENYPEGLEEAAHKLLAESKSKVVLLQLEDIFQSEVLQNLPGTDFDKYPNWYHRLPVDLEDVAQSEKFKRNLKAVYDGGRQKAK